MEIRAFVCFVHFSFHASIVKEKNKATKELISFHFLCLFVMEGTEARNKQRKREKKMSE